MKLSKLYRNEYSALKFAPIGWDIWSEFCDLMFDEFVELATNFDYWVQ